MRIGLLPLDERPANTRYPAMIAAIAGAELVLPPAELLCAWRRPANCAALAHWLEASAPGLDGLIVAIELLGYGGLIASRISDEPVSTILARLEPLRRVRAAYPRLPIFGFNLITRVSNANDAVEEPVYWDVYGTELYAFSQLLDRRGQGQPLDRELARLEAIIPVEHRRDLLTRRLRNHTVNLAALGLLADGVFDLLVLSSDDTSPFGLPSGEKRWLASWAELLGIAAGDERLLIYPGADEVGCTLLARLLNREAGITPTVAVCYAPPAAAANIAAYEDGPISLTVERQVLAAGGRCSVGTADLWLGVNAPLARRAEWDATHADAERASRLPALTELVDEAAVRLSQGQAVALADVAYPNGADPALMDLLAARVALPALAAYGAWNTAGNTLGSVVAQSFAMLLSHTPEGRAAQQQLLLHRLVEDWGYQQVMRSAVRQWLQSTSGQHDPRTPEALAATVARIEAGLNGFIERLPGYAGRWRIVPGSVRLPWGRTFEVDFALAPCA